MAVDKALYQAPVGLDEIEEASSGFEDMEVSVEDPDEIGGPDGDGGEGETRLLEAAEFGGNLAEAFDEDELQRMADDLMEEVSTDLLARADWEKAYSDGIKLLGLKPEDVTDPWPGACSLTHPMLTEAVVRFQSETIMETFPAAGPVKTNIIGVSTPEKEEAAKRVKEDLNYQIMEVMSEYRPEHERMLWNLPLAGSAFKKVYYDPSLKRQVSLFVPAEDVILPYGASSLGSATCPRLAHRMRKTKNELVKLQRVGFYRDVELEEPEATPADDDITEAKDKEAGADGAQDNRYQLYEVHTEFDPSSYMKNAEAADEDEDPKPYVVTIEKGSNKILAIRRNWIEEDELALPRQHFVHYMYIPGFGAYGFGLIHLIGNYVRGATSFLRQLGDAGTLANLPAGFKTKGMRVKNENEPIRPGEFRDADVVSGVLRDNLVPLPFKEPSQTLLLLLNSIVEDGRRLAATADLKISDMSAQAPVGTTLAILERMLKVMSAIQARVHYSMKQELRLLAGIIRDYAEDEYNYDVEAPQGRKARGADYDMVDIIPVSDPNAATMSQKIVQYQAVMQLAQAHPQIYNMQELHRQMLDVLGVKNVGKLIPTHDDMKPMDPISENMGLMNGKPVKAFIHQDHEAHLTVHMTAAQDPLLREQLGQNPKAQQMMGAFYAHTSEHLAFLYRQKIEEMMGTPLPPPDQPLPPEVEVQLSRMVAQAAQKLLGKNTVEAQAKAAEQAANDPVLQNEAKDLEIREKETNRKILKDIADTVLKGEKLDLEREKQESEQFSRGADIGLKATKIEGDQLLAETAARQQQMTKETTGGGDK